MYGYCQDEKQDLVQAFVLVRLDIGSHQFMEMGNKLVDQIAKYIGVALTVSKVNRCDLSGGGLFYSGNQNGVVFSAVYHPTREHSASVRPGSNAAVFPSTKAWVVPGKWAISYTTANWLGGNKAYYDLK